MTNFIPENIDSLLSMYTFDVDLDSINEDLTCNLCRKLLHDAYQTICDCKYCRKCIDTYVYDGNEYCPGGKNECREEKLVLDRNVFRNLMLNKKVMRVKVHCPNESCQFTSTLTQMEDHLRVCTHQPMQCPYMKIGCTNARVNRDSVETHLNRETLAHSQILIQVFDNLKNEVGGLKEELRVTKLEIASFREEYKLKEREIREDERRMGHEERDSLTAVVEELKGQVAAMRGQMECAEENQKRLKKSGEEMRELLEERKTEREELRKMRVEVEALKMEIGTEREESRKMRGEIEVLQGDVKRIDYGTSRLKECKEEKKETEFKKPKITDVLKNKGKKNQHYTDLRHLPEEQMIKRFERCKLCEGEMGNNGCCNRCGNSVIGFADDSRYQKQLTNPFIIDQSIFSSHVVNPRFMDTVKKHIEHNPMKPNEGKMWACVACTFLNNESNLNCETCGIEK